MANQPYFTIKSASGGWRARFYGGNGELMFWTEVHTRLSDAQHAVAVLQTHAASAPVKY
jgi:uncharacterized protein YegP (UPF0339 family)